MKAAPASQRSMRRGLQKNYSAVAMLSLPENKGKIGFFGGVKEAKFRRQVVPGDLLKLEVEIIKIKGPVGVGKALATVNGEKAVSAEISFALK